MTELKIGGNNVGKIMYNGQEFGGSQMLESGTILLDLSEYSNWPKERLGFAFNGLGMHDSITCKAFGVEKDWKNVSKIRVLWKNFYKDIIDISELKKGPQKLNDGYLTVTLEGKELTFENSGTEIGTITVEAYNE